MASMCGSESTAMGRPSVKRGRPSHVTGAGTGPNIGSSRTFRLSSCNRKAEWPNQVRRGTAAGRATSTGSGCSTFSLCAGSLPGSGRKNFTSMPG